MRDSKSCIDLIFTNQLNIFIEYGVYLSLHEQCHHQIVHKKLSIKHIALPPYTRRIWYYDMANVVAIKKSIEMFKWREYLDNITFPNEQVKLLNEVLLNIYSNFFPYRIKRIKPHQVHWITPTVKNFLRNKCRACKILARNGQLEDTREGIQKMIAEGLKMIEDAKRDNFLKAGKTLASHGTPSKTYWPLISTVLHKAKIPIMPSILENGLFLTDFTQKAQLFYNYFILQCTTIDTGSEIPKKYPGIWYSDRRFCYL